MFRPLLFILFIFLAPAVFAGSSLRIGYLTGFFNPPTKENIDFLKKSIQQNQLDIVYIIPQIFVPPETNIVPYSHRLQMVKESFNELPQIRFPTRQLEEATILYPQEHISDFLLQMHPQALILNLTDDRSINDQPYEIVASESSAIAQNELRSSEYSPRIASGALSYIRRYGLYGTTRIYFKSGEARFPLPKAKYAPQCKRVFTSAMGSL